MIVHYQNSLMRPHVPLLQHLQARPVLDAQRQLSLIEGSHSFVAKLRRTDGHMLALRMLTSPVDSAEWQKRYAELRRLSLTTLKGRVPGGLEVIPAGLEIEGAENAPAQVMDWVQGPTLAMAVKRACQSGNSGVLRALSTALIDLVNSFRTAGVAHRHLGPDNLIISTNGSLVAVGLDAATWVGGPPSEWQSGPAAYRHPDGAGSPMDADAFASLVLYASLRVLADAPDLAEVYGDPAMTMDGALLFSSWDLADPGVSRSFADAMIRVTPETREFVDALHQACLTDSTEGERWLHSVPKIAPVSTPRFEEAIPRASGWDIAQAVDRVRSRYEGDEQVSDSAPEREEPAAWSSWQQPRSHPGPQQPQSQLQPARVDPWQVPPNEMPVRERIEPLPASPQPDKRRRRDRGRGLGESHPRAARIADVRVRSAPSIPFDLVEDVPEIDVDEFSSERALLLEALKRRDEVAVAQIWPLLDGDPVSRGLALHVKELAAVGLQNRIRQGADRKQDDTVLELADQAKQRELVLDPATRQLVHSARERVRVRSKLDQALMSDSRADLADRAVSGDLMVLGETDRASLRTVLRALEWPILERALATDDDQIIVDTYDAEVFDHGRELSEDARNRIDLASRRLTWRVDVRQALKSKNVSSLEDLFQNPPVLAIDRLSMSERRRTRRLIEQRRALDALRDAIRDKEDAKIVTALNHVERVGARIEDRHTWNAIQTVVERASMVEDILSAAKATPIDVGRLAQLVPAGKTLGVDRDPRLRGEFSLMRLEERLVRHAHTTRIRAAIARDDDTAIVVAAVPDPYSVLDDLSEGERARIASAILARRRVDRDAVAERFERSGSAATV
ncbi:MAG: hypothetical protein ACR2OU_20985 [Thermomicrobiales bacterium]